MAKFTEHEELLLKHVDDDRLHSGLAIIRQAAEDIWAADAPRIIQDFTEHGVLHSERLASYAAKLLQANDGTPLSAQEMYLLLAGIYLHDIGMQCDVVKFPEIKEQAEALGAEFDIEFTAPAAREYSIDEQKAIRKNHQYLSAAWIDHAYRTGETVLGLAARTVPEDMVDDLMDVCKHHAKLPIADCPISFRFDPNGRKQLAAALLRFADELDVDGHRVSIETVRNFRLHPRNSVYWWLHNCTYVDFTSRSVVVLTVRLNPNDSKLLGSYVHTAFIDEFRRKNRPVLSILAKNDIPIVIDDSSKVVEHERTLPLPAEIVEALYAMQKENDSQQRDERTMEVTIRINRSNDFIGGVEGARTLAYRLVQARKKTDGPIFVNLTSEAVEIAKQRITSLDRLSPRSPEQEKEYLHLLRVRDNTTERGQIFVKALHLALNNGDFSKGTFLFQEDRLVVFLVGLMDVVFGIGTPLLPGETGERGLELRKREHRWFVWWLDDRSAYTTMAVDDEELTYAEKHCRAGKEGRYRFGERVAFNLYELRFDSFYKLALPTIAVFIVKEWIQDQSQAVPSAILDWDHWRFSISHPDKVFYGDVSKVET